MLVAIFEKILGHCPYKSPTDMGVNMVGNCIVDDEAVRFASRQEIIRRYYVAMCEQKQGKGSDETVRKLELLMKKAGVTPAERKVVAPACSGRSRPARLPPPWNCPTVPSSPARPPTFWVRPRRCC